MKQWITRALRSKTMIMSMVISILGVIEASSNFLQSVLTPSTFGWLMMFIGVMGAVLRVLTTQPLKDK